MKKARIAELKNRLRGAARREGFDVPR